MPPPSTTPIRAAGAVLWRQSEADDELRIAVVPAGRNGACTLPGARLEPGETEVEAAVRAVRAAGHAGAPGRFLGTARGRMAEPDGHERLLLTTSWAVRAEAEGGLATWLAPAEAAAALTAEADRQVLERFLAGPAAVGRVLLLRHCEAEQWRDGDDTLRPLTAVGRARAERLADVVAALAPAELVTSPARRCVDTLAPAARRLGREPAVDPLYGEQADPDASVADLGARARRGGTVLVCTHAPVVVGLLERFAADRPALLPRPARLDAGGAWSLEFSADGPIAMSYLPPPAPAQGPW